LSTLGLSGGMFSPYTRAARHGQLDTSSALVGPWRRRFADQRLEGLKDKPRAGHPRRVLSPAAGRRCEGGRVRAAGPLRTAAEPVLAH
jgi:hypothetical protein